ncbi:helix-hairpin-helix domain-containing protein [Caldalkalibacillus salinus]|uniref:helix-hairpin-helix domain-containing protein n=1 Tax=Caldalkalibacillus salinus TaxID=2803787 RepID=UPI0019222C74|nr:helix-hairpin-helix domain-containing protein [Caldalkalibacillus salinus]
MRKKNPKLPLTQAERRNLRRMKVKVSEVSQFSLDELSYILDTTPERAREIKGLATFQQIPSIGHELADKLVTHLGLYDLEQIKDQEWTELCQSLELKLGCWTDPCVEDQIMCVIHHANHPGSDKQWFDFTEERKAYREAHGYPQSRPKTAWYEKV